MSVRMRDVARVSVTNAGPCSLKERSQIWAIISVTTQSDA